MCNALSFINTFVRLDVFNMDLIHNLLKQFSRSKLKDNSDNIASYDSKREYFMIGQDEEFINVNSKDTTTHLTLE